MGKGDMEIAVGLDRGLGLSWGQYRELGRYAVGLGYQSIWTNASNGRDSLHVCAQWSVAIRRSGGGWYRDRHLGDPHRLLVSDSLGIRCGHGR